MGCFESKTKKKRAQNIQPTKITFGQHNTKWKKLVQNPIVSKLIIQDINGVAEHPAYKAIDKDTSRTFPNEEFFIKETNISLFKDTLKCFALTFPKIGYTQGLNFLAGYLLLNKMEKIETLNILASIMVHPSLMLLGLYEDDFPLAHLYCELFWKILKKEDAQLYDCLKLINFPDHMWIFQWYLTFFLYSFPIHYVTFYLNEIFQHKQSEMVLVSVGIVVSMRNDILGMPEKDEICFMQVLQHLKSSENCMKIFSPQSSIEKAKSINKTSLRESIEQIKRQQKIDNFYIKYFSCEQNQRKVLYEKFISEIQSKHQQLSNSKNNEKLMESYKRNRQTVEILDEILLESIKRQINRKYKSNMLESRKNRVDKNLSFKKWKSLAHLEEEEENEKEGETTVSIVKKVVIQEDKQQ